MDNCFDRDRDRPRDGGRDSGSDRGADSGNRRPDWRNDLDRQRPHEALVGARGRGRGPGLRKRPTAEVPAQQPIKDGGDQEARGREAGEPRELHPADPQGRAIKTDHMAQPNESKAPNEQPDAIDGTDKQESANRRTPDQDTPQPPNVNELREIDEKDFIANSGLDISKDVLDEEKQPPQELIVRKATVSRPKQSLDAPYINLENREGDRLLHRFGEEKETAQTLDELARREKGISGNYGVLAVGTPDLFRLKGQTLARKLGVSTAEIEELEKHFEIRPLRSREFHDLAVVVFEDMTPEIAELFNKAFKRKEY